MPQALCDRARVPARVAARHRRLAFFGERQDRRDTRGFGHAQPAGIMAEIALRPGVDPIGRDTGLGDVEIDFHDAALAPDILDQDSEPGL